MTTELRRRIAVLTTGRQDWGILHSTCGAIRAHPDLELRLLVGGTHLSERHGRTVDQVRADGFEPDAEFAWLDDATDRSAGRRPGRRRTRRRGRALRAAPVGCARCWPATGFETAAAALAATVDRVPIVHLHGGEQTLGAFDDALRHAITKLSHLHLVSSEEHARRVDRDGRGPGQRPRRRRAGAGCRGPRRTCPIARDLERDSGIALEPPVVRRDRPSGDPGAGPGRCGARRRRGDGRGAGDVRHHAPEHGPRRGDGARRCSSRRHRRPGRVAVDALGEARYWGLLRIADAVLGNRRAPSSRRRPLVCPR